MITYCSRIPVSREFFRPSRGLQGYYYTKSGKLFCSFYNGSATGGGGASGIIYFKKDTLLTLVNRVEYYYQKVENVNPDWLKWKPDW